MIIIDVPNTCVEPVMSRYSTPCIVWLDPDARTRLMELAQRVDAPVERVGGGLLTRALLAGAVADLGRQHEPDKAKRAYNVPRAAEGRARARGR